MFVGVCIFGLLVAVVIYVVFKLIGRSPELPLVLTNQYWGIGDYCPDVEHVIPFKIELSNEVLNCHFFPNLFYYSVILLFGLLF